MCRSRKVKLGSRHSKPDTLLTFSRHSVAVQPELGVFRPPCACRELLPPSSPVFDLSLACVRLTVLLSRVRMAEVEQKPPNKGKKRKRKGCDQNEEPSAKISAQMMQYQASNVGYPITPGFQPFAVGFDSTSFLYPPEGFQDTNIAHVGTGSDRPRLQEADSPSSLHTENLYEGTTERHPQVHHHCLFPPGPSCSQD